MACDGYRAAAQSSREAAPQTGHPSGGSAP